MTMRVTVGYVAKFVTALVAAGGIALSQGLIVGTAAKWAAVAIGAAGAIGVYAIPNTSPAGATPAGPSNTEVQHG